MRRVTDRSTTASIGLNRLSTTAMEDAPDAKYISSIQGAVNGIVNQLETSQMSSFIQLLKSADVELAELSVQVPDPWIKIGSSGAPAFQNAWANFGGGYAVAKFMKHPDGSVEVQGTIALGTIGNPAFTLPVGYRPAETMHLGTCSNGAFGEILVGSDGKVYPVVGSNVEFTTSFRFMALDATPIPLSCWPKYIATNLTSVAGVVVCDARDNDQSAMLFTGSGNVSWEITSSKGVKQVKILNIPFLPYNRKCSVKVLIFGGG